MKDNNDTNGKNIPHDAHNTPNSSPPSNKTKMTPKDKKANMTNPKTQQHQTKTDINITKMATKTHTIDNKVPPNQSQHTDPWNLTQQ